MRATVLLAAWMIARGLGYSPSDEGIGAFGFVWIVAAVLDVTEWAVRLGK